MDDKKNYVRNDTALVDKHPIMGLAIAGFPGGIEASEAAGQRQLVASEVLPVDITHYRVGEERRDAIQLLESWGFVFGEGVQGDPIFRHAKLPPGWKKEATEHSMWSRIVDEKGRERCSVFYKAAFYDRSATMHVSSRYRIDHEYRTNDRTSPVRGLVKEGDTVLFQGPWHENEPGTPSYVAYEDAAADARAWLIENLSDDLAEQWAMP